MLDDVTDYCRLVLVRHPEVQRAAAATAVGSGPAELSRRGLAGLPALRDRLAALRVGRVTAAAQPQCSQPARALADQLEVDLEIEPRLDDQNMGAWQGRAWDEIARDAPDAVRDFFAAYAERRPPAGESLGEAVERFLQWWSEAAPEASGQTIAVIAAGAPLSGFTAAMLGMRLSRSMSLRLPPAGIGIVDVFANGVRISAWNATALAEV